MILIVGGIASGKRTFARTLGFCDDDMADAELMADAALDGRPVVVNAQALAMTDPRPERTAELEDMLATKACVIAVEVGSGIVPIDARERAAREQAGRLVNRLARRADLVVRMVCGIPTVLKGSLEGTRGPGGNSSASSSDPVGPSFDGSGARIAQAPGSCGVRSGASPDVYGEPGASHSQEAVR